MFSNDPSPDQRAGIIVFLVFMLLMAALAVLGAHSRAHAQSKYFKLSTAVAAEPLKYIETTCRVSDKDHFSNKDEELIRTMTRSILNQLVMCRQRSNDEYLYHKFCREDNVPCEQNIKEYTQYIVKHAKIHKIDPWFAAAVAMHETHFDAYLKGKRGERSIFQLLPGTPWAKKSKFAQSAKHREQCKNKIGHCQEESVGAAVELLGNSLKMCKNVSGALSMYNGGECHKESTVKYVKGVKEKLHDLKTNSFRVHWCS